MDASLNPALSRLNKGEVRSLDGEPGLSVALFEGRVWITQDGDPRDVVIDAGADFAFDRRGRVVIEALSDALLLMLERRDGAVERHRV